MQADLGNNDGNESSTDTSATSKPLENSNAGHRKDAVNSGEHGASTGANWFRRFFWLDEKLARAASSHFGPTQSGWIEFEYAREVRTILEEAIGLGESNFSVLLLARNEVMLLLRCHVLRHGLEVPELSMSSDDWARIRQVPIIDEVWGDLSTNQYAMLNACYGPEGEASIIGLEPKLRAELIDTLKETASRLMRPLQNNASEVGRVLGQRWLRVGTLCFIILILLWNVTRWALDRSGSVNLARNRPVSVSSQEPGTPTDHRGLVDGDRTTMGFHTQIGPNQFAVIDLGSAKKFDKVVVYNRMDCCKERAVPLQLEVSDEGNKYRKLDVRREVFDVWTARMLRARGRYVRLRLLEPNYLHLAEVEIY